MLSILHVITAAILIAKVASSSIEWVNCHNNVPLALSQTFPGANITTLPPTLHCGQIVVPMDYDKPIGPKNNITLGLAMYRPEKPNGVLF